MNFEKPWWYILHCSLAFFIHNYNNLAFVSIFISTSKTTGIGAARNWIKTAFENYGVSSGGRLKVSFDTFTQPADGRRITAPVVLKNVMAVLPGTDPNDKRMFLFSGHYDSRVTDVMNSKDFAPGANDDASGVAAVMEMCRIMSKQKFSATLVFVAMVGEEQGLYGATNLAKRAKEEGWNVNLLMNNDIVGNSYGMETDIKDNYFFGVQSVDEAGHESLVIIPKVGR